MPWPPWRRPSDRTLVPIRTNTQSRVRRVDRYAPGCRERSYSHPVARQNALADELFHESRFYPGRPLHLRQRPLPASPRHLRYDSSVHKVRPAATALGVPQVGDVTGPPSAPMRPPGCFGPREPRRVVTADSRPEATTDAKAAADLRRANRGTPHKQARREYEWKAT